MSTKSDREFALDVIEWLSNEHDHHEGRCSRVNAARREDGNPDDPKYASREDDGRPYVDSLDLEAFVRRRGGLPADGDVITAFRGK